MGFLDFLKKGLTPTGIKAIPFFKAVPTLLKAKLEETTLLPFLPKVRVPIPVKIAAGVSALFPQQIIRTVLPITFRKAAVGFTATGILIASPKARKFIVGKIKDPTGVGREIGAIIEDPSKLQPDIAKGETTIGKIKEVAKAAGVVGGVAAVTAAAIAAIKRAREKEVPETFAAIPTLPDIRPIGVVKKPVEAVPVAVTPTMPDIKIRNVFKPEINVRVSHSKRFINQQILMR